ncbi:hypothetical protein F0M18_13650 [Pseudohalioglobus sediminis]|uniref:Uncharacterized protein n=1 Tax=Pseudohalioglobus sediminis TaxID=2606449 RepID=A0A5B0WUY1_9GAMM|nr:hypothetical protein [Pseudohalioglobus sediminis]KAA1190105.1 hypothetical protein F0M18_13650 [Pseudohalioglobus sediminis]
MRLKIMLLVGMATVLLTILLDAMGIDPSFAFWVCGAAFGLVCLFSMWLVGPEMELTWEFLLFTGCGQPAIWALEVHGPVEGLMLLPALRNLENSASGFFEQPPCGTVVASGDRDFEYFICEQCLAHDSTLPLALRRSL